MKTRSALTFAALTGLFGLGLFGPGAPDARADVPVLSQSSVMGLDA